MKTKDSKISHKGRDFGSIEIEVFETLDEVVSFLGEDKALSFINRGHTASTREKFINSKTKLNYKELVTKLKDQPEIAKQVAGMLGVDTSELDLGPMEEVEEEIEDPKSDGVYYGSEDKAGDYV